MSELDDFIDMLMDEKVCYAVVDNECGLDEPVQGAYAVADYYVNGNMIFTFVPIERTYNENKRAER